MQCGGLATGQAPTAGRAAAVTAAVTGGSLLVAVPLISTALRLSPVLPTLLVIMTVAIVVTSRFLGELQGKQRFLALSLGLVMLGVGRYAGVIVGLWMGLGVVGSLGLGTAVAWLALPSVAILGRRQPAARQGAGPTNGTALSGPDVRPGTTIDLTRLGREVAAASTARAALLAVSSADLILARLFLSPAEAGAYAVGAILTKAAFGAPQVFTILALPRMAQGDRRALITSVASVAICGAALVTAAAVAGDLAMRLAGGPTYVSLGYFAWAFAAVGRSTRSGSCSSTPRSPPACASQLRRCGWRS